MTRTSLFSLTVASSLFGLVMACSTPSSPARSPNNNDVQPPTTTTGDGKVIGADEVPPAQKLEQSPRLDAKEGFKPAATPGHE